jgi:hypothetical protein
MLVRLLYASRPATELTQGIADAILTQSRKRNPAAGVTGLLCVAEDVFIQVLEGGRDEVCDIYHAIVRDTRHKDIKLLSYEEIGARRFGSWTMGQVHAAKINPSLLLKYFSRATLNPFDAPGHATMALLDELVATAAIAGRAEQS